MCAGIDVSLKELSIAWKNRKGERQEFSAPNTAVGHKKLADMFGRTSRPSRIVIEATGSFHIDLAIRLAEEPGIEVMIVNPLAARRFAQAQMRRAKTDRVDALMLLEFAERMEFVAWTPPRAVILEFRAVGRHLSRLVEERTALQNQIAAASATSTTPAFVLSDVRAGLTAIEARIGACQAEALRVVASDEPLTAGHRALVTVKGIADRSAILIASELAVLDPTMTADEVVAQAGLDPRPYQSGTLKGARRTSKVGNARLRGAMFMPAMVAARYNPPVREWYESLIQRGKGATVAFTAVARRLLRTLWVIYKTKTAWDDALFRPKAPRVPPAPSEKNSVTAPAAP